MAAAVVQFTLGSERVHEAAIDSLPYGIQLYYETLGEPVQRTQEERDADFEALAALNELMLTEDDEDLQAQHDEIQRRLDDDKPVNLLDLILRKDSPAWQSGWGRKCEHIIMLCIQRKEREVQVALDALSDNEAAALHIAAENFDMRELEMATRMASVRFERSRNHVDAIPPELQAYADQFRREGEMACVDGGEPSNVYKVLLSTISNFWDELVEAKGDVIEYRFPIGRNVLTCVKRDTGEMLLQVTEIDAMKYRVTFGIGEHPVNIVFPVRAAYRTPEQIEREDPPSTVVEWLRLCTQFLTYPDFIRSGGELLQRTVATNLRGGGYDERANMEGRLGLFPGQTRGNLNPPNIGGPSFNGALKLYAVVLSQVPAGGRLELRSNNLPDEAVARLVDMGVTRAEIDSVRADTLEGALNELFGATASFVDMCGE